MKGTNPLRWGIPGAAGIARKNRKAIRHSDNSIVSAVASRDQSRARQFIADCRKIEPFDSPPTVFDTYEELIASPEVDAVYLPLPTAPLATQKGFGDLIPARMVDR